MLAYTGINISYYIPVLFNVYADIMWEPLLIEGKICVTVERQRFYFSYDFYEFHNLETPLPTTFVASDKIHL